MSFCTECGTKLADGVKFCPECGSKTNSNIDEPVKIRKESYEGEIRKCPNCGEILKSFTLTCPQCGNELRGARGSAAVQDFARSFEDIENKINSEPKPKFSFKETIINKDQDWEEQQKLKLNTKKADYIKHYPIPNSKEDLIEFLIMAASNVDLDKISKAEPDEAELLLEDAWNAKFEQAYQKAKVLLINEPEFDRIDTLYKDRKKEIKKARTAGKWKHLFMILGIIGFMILIYALAFIFIK